MSAPVTGNKAELAHRLGVSLPTLSLWMQRYGDAFPVLERGSNGRGYVFDFRAVFDFLAARKQEQADAQAERDEALAQLVLPFAPVAETAPPPGTLSLQDQFKALQLRRLQREEAERSGQLVPAADIQANLAMVLGRLSRDAHAFLRQIGREQGWPDAYTRAVTDRFADMQREAVRDLDAAMSDDAPATPVAAYA